MKAEVVECIYIAQGTLRLDGSFYMNDNSRLSMALEKHISKCSYLGELAVVMNPPVFKRQFCQNTPNAVQYFQSSDVQNSSERSEVYVNKAQAERIKAIVKANDILVTGFGTIGNIRLVSALQNGVCYANNVARIRANKGVPYGYLYAFMNTKYACAQLNKNASGSVVRYIEAPGIKRTLIPLFPAEFQNKIDAQIKEAAALRVEANKLLEEAKRKVEEFVGVVFNKQTGYKTQSVSIQDVHKSFQLRLDPPAIISDSIKIMDRIKNSTVQLGDCKVDVWYPGVFKRTYTKNGVPYIKGSELMMTDPFKRCERLSKSRTPNIEQLYLKEDYILITCAGACGDVKLITKEYEEQNSIGSPDIVRVKSNDSLFTHSYLFAYLKTKLAYEYMQSMKYGSVIERFDADHVRSIPIVKPTKELSKEVTALIDKYKDCTYNAYCLERSAIKAVEDEINSWGK